MLLRQMPLEESSFGSIAAGLLERVALDLPLDEPTLAAQRYVTLTAADVKAAFVKWVRPDGFVEVVQGPAPTP
jgi:zinc protease